MKIKSRLRFSIRFPSWEAEKTWPTCSQPLELERISFICRFQLNRMLLDANALLPHIFFYRLPYPPFFSFYFVAAQTPAGEETNFVVPGVRDGSAACHPVHGPLPRSPKAVANLMSHSSNSLECGWQDQQTARARLMNDS